MSTPDLNKTVETAVAELNARLILLERDVKEKDDIIARLTVQLKNANDHIDSDTRSRLIAELEKTTDYTLNELVAMDADRLRQVRDDQKRYKPPKFVSGADKGEAKGDKYEPLATIYGKYARDKK